MFKVKRFLIGTSAIISLLVFTPVSALAAPSPQADGTMFDAQFYAQRYPDVVEYYGTTDPAVMYRHYQEFGKTEGRLPYAGAVVEKPVVSAGQPAQPQPAAPQASAQQEPEVNAQKQAPASAVHPASAPPMPSLTPDEEQKLRTYFQKAVFIGDSIMAGYRNYLTGHKNSVVSGATFLCAASYSAEHALHLVDSLHPAYRGKKVPVWQSIGSMDADRVFIMFGTNDLVVKDSWKTAANIFALVDKIRLVNPNVEIHLISMTPVFTGAKNRGMLNNEGVQILNDELRAGLSAHGVDLVEINSYLQDATGGLRAEYCSDRYVHQTAAAYGGVWDAVLTAYGKSHS